MIWKEKQLVLHNIQKKHLQINNLRTFAFNVKAFHVWVGAVTATTQGDTPAPPRLACSRSGTTTTSVSTGI